MNVTYTIPSNPHIDGVYSYYTGLKDAIGLPLRNMELNSYVGFALFKDKSHADVIHNPTSYYYLMRKQSIPLVLTIMDAIQFLQPEQLSWKSRMYHKAFGIKALGIADHIITISEHSRKDLIACGIPADKLTVIYPGVNPLYFTRPEISQMGIEMKFGFICPYVLYVGGFNPRKNIERLIRTFMGAKEKYKSNYHLVLAGGYGWDNSLVYDLAKRFHKDVTIIQNPSNDELHALYTYASLFVYPSLYEGFGLPIAEAMACGCPVLCSDRASMPEVVGDRDLTFNPMQIPYEIFNDLENVPRSPNVFKWDRAAKETVGVYESCCDRAV